MTTFSARNRKKSALSSILRVALAILVMAVSAWIVARELKAIDPFHLILTLRSVPLVAVLACIAFSLASYGCLGLQEVYGLLILRRRLPPLRVVANATIANALAGVIGFGLATGTFLRLRLYRGSRLKARSIAKLSLLMSLANYVGGLTILGIGVLTRPAPIATALDWPAPCVLLAASALLAPAALALTIWRHKQRAVSTAQRLGALSASLGDWIFSGSALFIVSGRSLLELPTFLAAFCLGSLGGSLVGIPTGLGVLDATMVLLQGGDRINETAAGLIIYRVVYYAGPALCAAIILGSSQAFEIVRGRRKLPGRLTAAVTAPSGISAGSGNEEGVKLDEARRDRASAASAQEAPHR